MSMNSIAVAELASGTPISGRQLYHQMNGATGMEPPAATAAAVTETVAQSRTMAACPMMKPMAGMKP